MRVLVACSSKKARDRHLPYFDFLHVPEGEIVIPDVSFEIGLVSAASLTGIKSRKCTTVFEVADRDLTIEKLMRLVYESNAHAGWRSGNDKLKWDPHLSCFTEGWWRNLAENSAKEIARIALRYPIGTILERWGTKIVSRKNPKLCTRLYVPPPRQSQILIMINDAEQIRLASRSHQRHAKQMVKILEFAECEGLKMLSPLHEDATDVDILLGAEMAAGVLRFSFGENIEYVHELSREEKKTLVRRAQEKVLAKHHPEKNN